VFLAPIYLARILQGFPIGDRWPYRGGTREEVRSFLDSVVVELKRIPHLHIEANFDLLDDESSSSINVLCFRKCDLPTNIHQKFIHRPGIGILLSALAPLACLFPIESNQTYVICPSLTGLLPAADWQIERQEIVALLESLGFQFPSREDLLEPLPSEPWIPQRMWGWPVFGVFF